MGCLNVTLDKINEQLDFLAYKSDDFVEAIFSKESKDITVEFENLTQSSALFYLDNNTLSISIINSTEPLKSILSIINQPLTLKTYYSSNNVQLKATNMNTVPYLDIACFTSNITLISLAVDILDAKLLCSLLCSIVPLEPTYLRSLDDEKLLDTFNRILISLG